MNRFRRKKSKTPTNTEGKKKTRKHNCFQTPVSESDFCSNGSTKEDSLMFEMRRNSSDQALGTPMKKLLAEEMSKENEAKRRSPSVIARLMGLDGIMSPYNYEERSSRKSSMERLKFKDVYEDLEASHVINRRNSNDSGHSCKGSLLKYLEEQETLHSRPLCSHTAGLNSPYENYEANSKGWRSEIETSHVTGSRRRDCHLSYALESSEPEEEKTDSRNIVVLKTSVWKLCGDVKAISSSGTIVRDNQLNGGNAADYLLDFSDQRTREKREAAKEVTRQMKEALRTGRVTSPFSGIRGGDQSLSLFNVSETESDASSNRHRPSLSGSTESSIIQEAKKRLSTRWKKSTCNNSKYKQVIGKGEGSTLGEMLAVPESETKADVFDDMVDLGRGQPRDGLARYGRGSASERSPVGISSKDGWKDGYVRNSSRSRSLPPLGYKTRGTREAGGSPTAKEDVCRGRSRDVKANLNSSPENKKSLSPRQSEIKFRKKDTSPPSLVNSEHGHTNVSSTSSATSDELRPMLKNDSSAGHQEETNSQGPSEGASLVASTESSENSKDVERTSPISVLEDSSSKEVSSISDCFESVCSSLQELRMQLQQLKMESQGYTESPAMHEDVWPGSVTVSQENWESSYIVDLLIESGFNSTETDMFTRTWYSPNCPLGPWVFNNLENKYTDESTVPWPERKLLFDRVNSALVEIFQLSMNPLTVPVGNGIEEEIHKVLERQEKEAYIKVTEKNVNVTEKTIGSVDLGDEITEIGMEIEKLLIDDLITELVTM